MIPVDTRTAAQHRLARHTAIVVKTCVVLSGCILAYLIIMNGA